MKGFVGQSIMVSVAIIPEKKYPFKIVDTKAKNGMNIRYKLDKLKISEGKEYVLTIENLKKSKGRYHDIIYLTTDSPIQPKINIRVYGSITTKEQPGKKTEQVLPPKSQNTESIKDKSVKQDYEIKQRKTGPSSLRME